MGTGLLLLAIIAVSYHEAASNYQEEVSREAMDAEAMFAVDSVVPEHSELVGTALRESLKQELTLKAPETNAPSTGRMPGKDPVIMPPVDAAQRLQQIQTEPLNSDGMPPSVAHKEKETIAVPALASDHKSDTPPSDLPTAVVAKPTVVTETRVEEIKTPAYKSRHTRKLVLPNQMKVLLISDPELPQSAAGLANKDGSWQNPKDALGLAHFNEHMVFMGTHKYPKASSFDDFLTANGADPSNAATGSAVTQYAFSVDHEAFEEALDRFSNMFSEPLMTNAGLKKEINAVNQEYEMHKDDDGWRQNFVEKATANPDHPFHRFSIGTLHSLGKVDHDEILKFYESHYSSNLMSACVYTALPLDEAQKLVEAKFGKVPNRHLPEIHVDVPLLDPKLKSTAIWQKTEKTQYSVTMKWELPKHLNQRNAKKALTSPDRLLAHVLNYQGEDSMFNHLRKSNLVHSVGAGQSDKGFDVSMFQIDLSLTPAGFKKWKHVVGMVFEALAKVKKVGVPKHIFDTIRTTDLTGWQWQWRTSDVFNAAMNHASSIAHTLDFASYPYVDNIIQEWDPKGVGELLEVLHPKDMHIYAMSPEYPANTKDLKTQTEPHYHTEWKVEHLSKHEVEEWAAAEPASFLQIPPANPYLPKNLEVSKDLNPNPPVYPAIPHPKVLLDTDKEHVHIWRDDMFGDPYVSGQVIIKTDKHILKKHGVHALVNVDLLTTCLNHMLVTKMQAFDEAGLSWSLGSSTGTNFAITFSGTNTEPEHYQALMVKLAGYLRQASEGKLGELIDEDTFNMLKTSTLHSLENARKSSPSGLAFQKMRHTLKNMEFPVDEQIAAVKTATYHGVANFAPELFKRNFFKGFFSGQVAGEEVKKAWKSVVDTLSHHEKATLPKSLFIEETMRQLPEKETYLHAEGPTRGNCAVLMIDAGDLDCREREALSVLYQAVPNRFYSDLRSKQQTGYLVQSESSVMVPHHSVIYFVVQSSQYKPGDLFHRYNKFIGEMMADLKAAKSKTLPADKFKMIIGSKLSSYKTPNNNIESISSTMQTLIDNYDGDFRTLEKKQKITQDLEYEEVLAVAEKVFSAKNKRRLAVGYTKKGEKLDTLPAEFVEFKPTMGKFIQKDQFKCPVKGMGDKVHKLKGSGADSKADKAAVGDMKGPSASAGKLMEAAKSKAAPKKSEKKEKKQKKKKELTLTDVLPGVPKQE